MDEVVMMAGQYQPSLTRQHFIAAKTLFNSLKTPYCIFQLLWLGDEKLKRGADRARDMIYLTGFFKNSTSGLCLSCVRNRQHEHLAGCHGPQKEPEDIVAGLVKPKEVHAMFQL